MKEYIEREAALNELCMRSEATFSLTGKPILDVNYVEAIRAVPAADVRPVVTCGKCKYGKYTGTEWFCDKHSGHADKFGEDASYHEYHSKHWFCADGEARNNES